MKYILSPCGISLLTNQAQNIETKNLVFKYANEKDENNIPVEHRKRLEELINTVDGLLAKANLKTTKAMSAELHGIILLYENKLPADKDYHLLLSTDTWLGEKSATLVKRWIRTKNPRTSVDIHRQSDLQTKDISAFHWSLSDLVKKFNDELPSFSRNGYKVVFNLTGGFECVNGVLQSIAHFFADEAVYIFETSSELMRIPRLPIVMNTAQVVEDNITYFRNQHMDVPSVAKAEDIPETLLLKIDDETTLSPWGEVVWLNSQPDIYSKRLLPSPNPKKIRYSDKFVREVSALQDGVRIKNINERIDQLNRYLYNGDNPTSLNVQKLHTTHGALKSTHEIRAWSISDAKRIFGHFEEDCFVLDDLAKGIGH